MTLRLAAARSLFVGLLIVATGAAAPALAQHVVTDGEASKLTLDALTATPRLVVHRAAYRTVRMSWLQGWARERGHGRSAGLVHEASFHRGFAHEAAFRRSIRATGTTLHLGVSRRRRWS